MSKLTSRQINHRIEQTNTPNQVAATVRVDIPEHLFPLLRCKQYDEALGLFHTLPRSPIVTQSIGVCSMRRGNAEDAIKVFRSIALLPGTTVIRSGIEDNVRINYASALLMKGLPSGVLEVLQDLQDKHSVPSMQLRSAIDRWAADLPFWRRWDWKLGRTDPPNCHIPVDFELGIFPFTIPCDADKPTPPHMPPVPKRPHSNLAA